MSVVCGCPSFRAHAPSTGQIDGDADALAEAPPSDAPAATDTLEGGASPDAAGGADGGQVLSTGPICSTDGWCWESPLPQGNDLNAVWGSSPQSVWAVGRAGTILSWGGAAWAGTPSGTTQPLNGVWGTGPNDVWAVGNAGTIVHWTGSSWSTFSSPTTADLHAVWASGPSDAWAVGAQSSILHWTGQWIAQPNPGSFPADVTMVWGAGPDDVWFAGPTGIIRRKNQAWTSVPNLPDAGVHITALGGSGSDDIVATGADAAGSNIYVYVWNGADWGRIYETAGPPLTALAVRSANAIWASGANLVLNFNGTAWKTQFTGGIALAGLWLSSAADGWAVGKTGQMVRFDGTAWSVPPAPRQLTFTDAWRSAPPSAPAGDGGATDARTGDAGAGADGGLLDRGGPSLWLSGFDPAAAVHHGGVVWRGQAGVWEPVAVGDVGPLWSVWSEDGAVLWAAGETLFSGDLSGAPWKATGTAAAYRKVRGSGATSLWSVETSVHFSNRSAPWPQDGSQLWGLDVFSDYDVWATADSGGIFHWVRDPMPHWVAQAAPMPKTPLYAIGGASTDDMWAVGDGGLIRHWTQSQWSTVASGTTQPLRGVWARDANDVWAVGGAGTILRWDGARWSPSASGTDRLLYAVVGDATGEVWAVGEQSTILHRKQ